MDVHVCRTLTATAAQDDTIDIVGGSCMSFDESQQRVSVQLDASVDYWQTISAWPILVSTAALECMTISRNGTCAAPCETQSSLADILVRPPVLLTGTSAECIY